MSRPAEGDVTKLIVCLMMRGSLVSAIATYFGRDHTIHNCM